MLKSVRVLGVHLQLHKRGPGGDHLAELPSL